MNVKVYSGGALAYDNRLPQEKHYTMLSIRIQEPLNKGGTAKLILPKGHRLYNGFPALSVPVEIYRDGKLRWRGRPLPYSDDLYGRRTITCEGELCFLNDATMRPYSLSGTPEELFTTFLQAYNAAVDPWKQFVVGVVTVTADTAVELKNNNPEQVLSAVQKLRNKCGGYILFDSTEDGSRRINWFAELPYTCNQRIRLGSNLLDYSSSASVSGFATRIIPYGANGEDGNRIKINVDGKDYVDNLEAQAVRGVVEKSVIYDGVTDPAELQRLAERDVQSLAEIPETLQLSAVDLSRFDMRFDAFAVGQMVPAESKTHDISGYYALAALDEDLVQPGIGSVTLTQNARYYDGSNTLTSSVIRGQKDQESYADAAAKFAVDSQAWIDLFNKLTRNGEVKGLFEEDGQVVLNATYILAGILQGIKIIGESGSIGGFEMSDHTLTAKFRRDFDFTQEDVDKARAYYMGQIDLTAEEIARLDVTMNGRIQAGDAMVMTSMINGNLPNYTEGRIVIDATNPRECIIIEVTGGYRAGQRTVLAMGFASVSRMESDLFSCGGSDGYTGEIAAGDATLTVKGGIIVGAS